MKMESNALDEFCGSPFWNSTLTWYSDEPDLTKCFEKTVLVWIPSVFLFAFAAVEVFYLKISTKKDIPWNWFNFLKFLIHGFLLAIAISDLVSGVNKSSDIRYKVDVYTPLVKLLTYSLSAVLLYYNKKRGQQTSGYFFLFWFLTVLCSVPQFRTEILYAVKNGEPEDAYEYRAYIAYFPLVVLMFLLNFFSDRAPRYTKYPKTARPSPEESASFISRITFAWFDRVLFKGFRRPLTINDLYDLRPQDSAAEIVPLFEKHWEKSVAKAARYNQELLTDAKFKGHSGEVNFSKSTQRKTVSIMPAIAKTFIGPFVFGCSLKIITDIMMFVNPQILSLIISYVGSDQPLWKGILYAILLFSNAALQTLIGGQHFQKMFLIGLRIRTVLTSAIYKKSLRISNSVRKNKTVGEIVNLMAVDAAKFLEMTMFIPMLWSAPLQIILAMYFLWQELGPSVLAGLAIMILMIPLNAVIANKVKFLQAKQMKDKDERVKLMNEILGGIKVLKLYAWEESFEKQIQTIRAREIKTLKLAAYLNAFTQFIWNSAPFIVSLVTFATYVLIDENNVLDASKAFVSLALFNILRAPLAMFPMVISNLVQTLVSVRRINDFMNSGELSPDNVLHDPSETDPVVVENGTFTWGEETILKDINMRIEDKTLAAIVGGVGSGKSSLLSAMLGEMEKISGTVNTVGSIAYVPQQAWIQNATLKENIIFGKEYNHDLYEKVIDACALKPDFAMLPGGDGTEVGEKGINLSGGQKQRISLARAVYWNADVYLLDDPLSAVDSHVGKHIFEHVLGPKGILRGKTRVLVTHGITYLPQAHKIFVIKDGTVSETGTYQQLLDKKGAFAEFLLQHIQEEVENEEELDELQDQLLGTPIEEEISKQIVRRRSRTASESKSDKGSVVGVNGFMRQKSTVSVKSLKGKTGSTDSLKGGKGEEKKPAGRRGGKLIVEERAEKGAVKWEVYKHYLVSVGVWVILLTILFNIGFQGFGIGSNVWLGIWADDTELVVNGTQNTAKRDMYLGIYGLFGCLQACSSFVGNIIFATGTMAAAEKLHNYVLKNVMRLPMSFFDVTPSGRILGRFSSDILGVDMGLPMCFNVLFQNSIRVFGTLIVISYTTPAFVGVIIPVACLFIFIQRYYVASSRQLKRLESVTRSPIYTHFGETVSGVHVIRAYGQEDRFILDSEKKVDHNQLCVYPSSISNRWLTIRLETITNIIILFSALFAVLADDMMPSLVGLSISYSLQITQTLNFLVRMISDVETNIVAVERIKEYGEAPQEAEWDIPSKRPPIDWPQKGEVEFKEYSVRYRPGLDLVLKSVNFKAEGGEKIGIVGRTGAGKSSLTLSLFRIIEAAGGKISIDNINISEPGLHALRSKLTIIPQDAVLFSGSLRMNLDPFDSYSDDELWHTLEQAHLKEFVKGLAAGLHHRVSEGGENLSVGQRQLICLGRAILRKTRVLILDEATAAVDLETDDLIQKTIRTEFKDCTVLTIAHRLNTILDSDRVLVLDAGQVAEFDTPENLLKNEKSIFYGMCKDAGLA